MTKIRIWPVSLLLFSLLLGSLSAESTEVVVILSRSAGPYNEALAGLQKALNQEIEVFNMKGDLSKGRQVLRNCDASEKHVVVTIGTEAMLATNLLSYTVPVVYTMILNPVTTSRPKTTSMLIQISVDKQLDKIRALFPAAKRIGVLYNPEISSRQIQSAATAMVPLKLQLFANAVHSRKDIPRALTTMTKNNVDVLWLVIDKTIVNPMSLKLLIQHSWNEKLPLIGLSQNHVKGGALLALAADYSDIGKQTAYCVQAYLAGNTCKKEIGPGKIIVYVNSTTLQHMGHRTITQVPDMKYLP